MEEPEHPRVRERAAAEGSARDWQRPRIVIRHPDSVHPADREGDTALHAYLHGPLLPRVQRGVLSGAGEGGLHPGGGGHLVQSASEVGLLPDTPSGDGNPGLQRYLALGLPAGDPRARRLQLVHLVRPGLHAVSLQARVGASGRRDEGTAGAKGAGRSG